MTQVTQAAQVFGHGGGVHSIKVPIPDNPLGHTLVYVVDTDRAPSSSTPAGTIRPPGTP